MKPYRFESETILDAPIDDVFAFFSNAENLQRLTPAALHFRILTPLPIDMKVGTIIDYRIKVRGFPMRWQTEITVWEPGVRFVDAQKRGPYSLWIHEHRFTSHGNGTRMRDTIDYMPRGWIFAPLANALFVRHEVKRIFDYRQQVMAGLFGALPVT